MYHNPSFEVILNVYDLHDSNAALHSLGMGLYHTGIEVRDHEYSFSDGGILRSRPRLAEFGTLREQISMGIYELGMNEFNNTLSQLENSTFSRGRYNLTSLNCNHFTDALCFALMEQHIPEWINRMAGIGASVLPRPAEVKSKDTGNGSFAALGVVSNPTDPVKRVTHQSSSVGNTSDKSTTQSDIQAGGGDNWLTSVFGWFGGSSANSGTGSKPSVSHQTVTSKSHTNSTTTMSKSATNNTNTTNKPEVRKKELTDKQKELLAKVKGGGAN
jgi:hypothetical protein